jgi:hypothetical protein
VETLIVVFLLALFIGYLLDDDAADEADPLDLARSSITHLDREAEQAMAELRALDREERS